MKDERTNLEKFLWKVIGEPLYYCEECLRSVDVRDKDGVVTVKRNCSHDDKCIIAPRKSILSGKGYAGLSLVNKIESKYQQIGAKLTGRNV